jgi:ABC-2 type transport system ATP-binding protein
MLRRDIYALVERFRSEGRTVLLTTHYIEEAERLCDHVAIIDQGQVVAMGTPRELIDRSGKGTRLEVRLAKSVPADRLKQIDAVLDCRETDGIYMVHAQPATQAIVGLIHFLEANNNTLLDLHIAQPSLEDVFVEMTGRKLSE